MKVQLHNEQILWEGKEQELVSEIHLRDSEAERMKVQLHNEQILWEEKEQELVSEIHLRDSELTALEQEIREAATVIEELKSANREAEDVAMSRATHVHSLQSKLGDALPHLLGVRDIGIKNTREDLTSRFPFVRDLIKRESSKLSQIVTHTKSQKRLKRL